MSTPHDADRQAATRAFDRTVRRAFLVLLGLATIADIVDHLTRETDTFRAQGWHWPAFSVGSYVALSIVFLVVATPIANRGGLGRLVAPIVAFTAAMYAHIYATGPLMEWLFLDEGGLRFFPSAALVGLASAGYLVVHLLCLGVRRLRAGRGSGSTARTS